MVAGPDWEDMHPSAFPAGYEPPASTRPRRSWFRRRRPAPPPQFPTVEQLASPTVAKTTCVCLLPIARWPYPGQGTGTAGDEHWWVHVDYARRSHPHDTLSPYFWTGVRQEPFAKPVWQQED